MKAIILKNLQNDFLEVGAVPLKDTDKYIEEANDVMLAYDVVIAVQKWYPADHRMFAANHLWRKPEQEIEVEGEQVSLHVIHCIAYSFGANFPKNLNQDLIGYIVRDEGNGPESVLAAIKQIVAENNIETIEVLGPIMEGDN